MAIQFELEQDEHEVPTKLGERVPMLPLIFPFDWSQRQVYWFALCFYFASNLIAEARSVEAWVVIGAYLLLGLVGVVVDYMVKPTPEFWVSAWMEYLLILLVSFPRWCTRLIPFRRQAKGVDWPLAVMPMWLGKRLVMPGEIQADGVIRIPSLLPRRKPNYAVVIAIPPRPHPDMLAMNTRAGIIQTRLNIFKHIRGRWSLHLEVRPFDVTQLEIASGPAWDWVKQNVAGLMVLRRPSMVLYGESSETLLAQATTIVHRFHAASMAAALQTSTDAHRLAGEVWSDLGPTISQRVRIGLRRVVTGRNGYRSWALVELPRIIHLGWLRPLTSESLLCTMAIHVNVRRPGPTRRSLQRHMRQWRALDQDDDYALAVSDAHRTITTMRRNEDTAATVGIYVTARAEQATQVAEALESAQCEFRAADVMQHRALRATRPLGGDPLNRTMAGADLRTVATTDLLATAGYWPNGATLIGEAMSAPEPIGLNLFDEDSVNGNLNWAMFIAMMQGSGKTTFAQTLAWRMANPHPLHALASAGLLVVSVDFKASGDYAQLYERLADRGQKASYNTWTEGAIPNIDGHMGFNLSNVPEAQHGEKLIELTSRLEEWAARELHSGRPLLLLLDEVLAVLEARNGPSFLRRFGTQGRSLGIAPVFCSQDIEQILANRKAALAFKNCATVFVGRQNPAGLNAMAPLLNLDNNAQMMLENAPQGCGILRVERKSGPVVLGLQVRPTEWELEQFGTNPGERARRWRKSVARALDEPVPVGAKSVRTNGNGHAVLASGLRRIAGVEAVEDFDS